MVRVCESNIIFQYVRPTVRRPSICPSLLDLKECESNFRFQYVRASVRGSVVLPCVRHTVSSYTTERNSNKLSTTLPLMIRVCESNIFLSVRQSMRPSISPSRYHFLNHWAEFNQTCYITSPHSKGV